MNLTLGRFLSIIAPGILFLYVISDFVNHIICKSSQSFLYKSESINGITFLVMAVIIGIMFDNLRRLYIENVFVKHANFYKMNRWFRCSYLKARLGCGKMAEADKPFKYWHKQYETAYHEAYKFWLLSKKSRAQGEIELARSNKLDHVLYGLGLRTWPVLDRNGKQQEKHISITAGQIWPILASRHKEAFRFHQEYFLSDTSANILVVFALSSVLYLGVSIGCFFFCKGVLASTVVRLLLFACFYIILASAVSYQQLAQMRFFKFLLLYETISALDVSKPSSESVVQKKGII